MRNFRRLTLWLVAFCIAAGVVMAAGLYAHGGLYALNVVLRRGGSYWVTIKPDDPKLPIGVRLGLQATPPMATAGVLSWHELQPGLDEAILPVLVNGVQIDSILLSRIDPARYHFSLLNAPAGTRDLKNWVQRLHPAVLVNASYYGLHGLPDTPFLSGGVLLSSHNSPAAGGAFIASSKTATVTPVLNDNWTLLFHGAHDALATYPLLVGPNGANTSIVESHWLADRTFVGVDGDGRIILGTTTSAFFSLRRFALFLAAAPLDLKAALNLDGGPVACQAIDLPNYSRFFCGQWEMQDRGGTIKHLVWPFPRRYALPVVLVAEPDQPPNAAPAAH